MDANRRECQQHFARTRGSSSVIDEQHSLVWSTGQATLHSAANRFQAVPCIPRAPRREEHTGRTLG